MTPKKKAVAAAAELKLSEDLLLPLDAVTETFAILAKRGMGKTSTAVVLTEELVTAGLPVVVVDPVGVWFGLRSTADGRGEGLPVVIFGGDHADVPLEPASGEIVARAIVEHRFSAVLDLSALRKGPMRRFMTDFLEALYRLNREPLHLVIDEADMFAPQARALGDAAPLLGAMEDLVRRGRARGLGTSLISQRPAALHKDVLSQAGCLVVLGMTSPRDVAAIDEWVRLHAEEDQARTVKASLPSLPVGTAWVWSPGWLGLLRRVRVRPRFTFDSSATPRPGVTRVVPQRMATVDLESLGEQIATSAEHAKSADPTVLRDRIRRLETDLLTATKASPAPVAPDPVVETIEVPVLDEGDRQALAAAHTSLEEAAIRLQALVREFLERVDISHQAATARSLPASAAAAAPARAPVPTARAAAPVAVPAAAVSTSPTVDHEAARPKANRAILSALATHGPLQVSRLALVTGYSAKSGGFRNALSQLRTAGLLEGRGTVELTPDGDSALGPVDPLPTGFGLLDWWKQHRALGKAERTILDVLADAHGAPVPIDHIAEVAGYSPTSGGFRNALSRLRSLGLAAGRGELSLAPDLTDN